MSLHRRLLGSLTTWPDRKAWLECLLTGLGAAVAIAVVAKVAGFLTFDVDPARLSPIVFLIPAFTEELAFRGPSPARGDTARPRLWLGIGVILFTLWHVVEATTFLPRARLFLTLGFLACAAILGAACAWMRYRTGSLWPGVLFHGVVVLLWQVLFSGPTITDLR